MKIYKLIIDFLCFGCDGMQCYHNKHVYYFQNKRDCLLAKQNADKILKKIQAPWYEYNNSTIKIVNIENISNFDSELEKITKEYPLR